MILKNKEELKELIKSQDNQYLTVQVLLTKEKTKNELLIEENIRLDTDNTKHLETLREQRKKIRELQKELRELKK